MSLMEQMKERMARRANVMSGREDEEAQNKQKKKRRVSLVAKPVVPGKSKVLVKAKSMAARPSGAGAELGSASGSDNSNSSFSDSDDDGGQRRGVGTAKQEPASKITTSSFKRRGSQVASNVIAKRPSLDPEDKSVGGFSTRGMKGLTALLAHKGSVPKTRTESFASTEDDWDSD